MTRSQVGEREAARRKEEVYSSAEAAHHIIPRPFLTRPMR